MRSCNVLFWLYLLGSSDVFCKLLGAEGKVGKHWFCADIRFYLRLNPQVGKMKRVLCYMYMYLAIHVGKIGLRVDPTKKLFLAIL